MASRGSYPHPVLDNSDDIKGDFRLSAVSVTPTSDFVDIAFDTFIENEEIRDLYITGSLTLRARWRCTATFSSGALALTADWQPTGAIHCTAALDHEDLDGRVDVTVMLVANQQLKLQLSSQHEDYDGAEFALAQGVLAGHAGTFSFDARKSYDPMRPPLESCFRFQEKTTKKPYIEIDTSAADHVLVEIPQAQYAQFVDQSVMPEVQIATVVLPALVQALVDCAEDRDPEVGGWKATLRALSEANSRAGDSPLAQAQAILGDPLATGFKRLALLVQDEETE
ncbi:hypothetical protein LL946_00105 [Knoellia locipacati]|uniref:hypothetical protein n=1 Tax=Knoellia locipacati TaxID=882824 RepID=UPI00384CD8E7